MTSLLTEEEISKIGTNLRYDKFSSRGSEMIYPQKEEEVVPNFLKAMRYLINITNNLLDTEIKKKIEDYLNNKADGKLSRIEIRDYLVILQDKFVNSRPFSKEAKRRELIEFVNLNRGKIEDTIDTVVPIGRVIKVSDPDQSAGYY